MVTACFDKSAAQKRLMELQQACGKPKTKPNNDDSYKRTAQKAKIAKLCEDCAEYEAEPEMFQKELHVVRTTPIDQLVSALEALSPQYDGNHEEEIKTTLIASWGCKDTNAKLEQLFQDLNNNFTLDMLMQLLQDAFWHEDVESSSRQMLIDRWGMLIAIKQEHINEELAEMKLRSMKPNHI